MRNIILLMLFAVVGCNNSNIKKSSSSQSNWVNPILNCHIPEIAEDINIEFGESELKGNEGIADFCKRMNRYFEKSNISKNEAQEIYNALKKTRLNLNESIGQPSPDDSVLVDQDFTKLIALKKVSDTKIELFYIKTGCGKTYFFGKFDYKKDKAISLVPIEVWKISYPC